MLLTKAFIFGGVIQPYFYCFIWIAFQLRILINIMKLRARLGHLLQCNQRPHKSSRFLTNNMSSDYSYCKIMLIYSGSGGMNILLWQCSGWLTLMNHVGQKSYVMVSIICSHPWGQQQIRAYTYHPKNKKTILFLNNL